MNFDYVRSRKFSREAQGQDVIRLYRRERTITESLGELLALPFAVRELTPPSFLRGHAFARLSQSMQGKKKLHNIFRTHT